MLPVAPSRSRPTFARPTVTFVDGAGPRSPAATSGRESVHVTVTPERMGPSTPEEPDERVLMVAYARGDRDAFARLFARLAPRIHGFFLRSFGSPSMADDLMQTTFMKIHKARGSYRPDLPLRPWVFAIAARVRVDELRKLRRLPEESGEDALERADDAIASNEAADAGRAASVDVASAVSAALEKLPETQRTVIHLHRYEGMTLPEIAQVLGTTEGAVKLRAFRGYEHLRRLLAPMLGKEKAQ